MAERQVVLVEAHDDPVQVDPATISHVILVAEAAKTDTSGSDPTEMVAELERLLNPKFWADVGSLGVLEGLPARSHLALVAEPVSPEAFMAVLEKLGVPDESSVFLRQPTVSLDGGSTSQEVASAFVFREDEPRILISSQEPMVVEDG